MSGNYLSVKNGNVAQPTTVSDQFVRVTEANGKIVYKQADFSSVDDKKVITSLSPVTSTPVSLNNAQVDFRIENNVDILQYPTLQWTLLNNTGANGSVVSAPFFIQRIDVYGGNGNTIVFTTYGEEINFSYMWLDKPTYEAQASSLGMNSTTYGNLGTVVADGNSIVMNLPLYGFWKAVGLYLSGIGSPLLVRVYFNPSSQTTLTGTAFTCSNLQMLLRGKMLKQVNKKTLSHIYSPDDKIPLSLAHLSVDRMAVPMNLSGSQQVSIVLTGITGVVAYLVFTVRLQSNVGSPANQATFIRMTNFDILDNQSTSLIGSYQRDIYTQQIDYANNFGNGAWTNSNFQIMSWSANPRLAFGSGTNSGFAIFTGMEKLNFICPSTLASNAYMIDIRAYCHEDLIYDNGVLKSTRT
jgi:hypothetical protein